MNFFRNCVVLLISSICFLPLIKTCSLRYNSRNSFLPASVSDEILENEDSAIRVRRDDHLFGLDAIALSEEETVNKRMGRKVIFANDSRIAENKTRPSQLTKMLNAAYYTAKDAYMYQQALKKRFNGVVPAGCHLIEGLPPAGGADNASAPAAPAAPVEETTTTAPPARRRKRDDETTTTAAPAPAAAENPGATTPPPGAATPAATTVITTTTPKPVSLVCPPSTTTPTTTIPTTTPAAAAAATPAADVTTTTAAPPPAK